MIKQYKLVIFDLDGTLLNTISDLAAAGNHALSQMGFPLHSEEKYKHFVGNGIPKLVMRMLPEGFSEETFITVMRLFNEYYALHNEDKTAPYEGISELLSFLSARGIKTAVNTNKAHNFSVKLIEHHFGDLITAVCGLKDGALPKPAPDGVRAISEQTGISTDEILYVGDSDVDVMTAKNAGIDCCSVLWGFRSREELEPLQPRYFAQNICDIERIFIKCDGQN